MTTVGKILVVLHLVLSVMFMAFAAAIYTAQTNWRKAHGTAAASLATAEKKNTAVRQEMETQQNEFKTKSAEMTAAIDKLKGQITALETEGKTLSADNKQLRKELDQANDVAALATTEAAEKKAEAALQRTKNKELFDSREDVIKKLSDTEEKRFELENLVQQISEKYDLLLNDFKTMKSFLASKDLTTDPKQMLAVTAPPPPLDGRVLETRKAERGSREYLEISLGSDAGLVVGHKLTVFRGKEFLGQLVLTLVETDKAAGYVSKRSKNAVFQVNDEVTTKF